MGGVRLIVFLRAPRRGEVKSRLAADLGPDAALLAYRELLEATLRTVMGLESVELRFTPDVAGVDPDLPVSPDWVKRPQGPGDLGERLVRALDESFGQGLDRVVVIGTDCPYFGEDDVRAAWALLETHDVVLGPALDGGYWLVGLNRPRPELFRDIPWGSDGVCAETLSRARNLGLRIAQLRPLADVDTADDWASYCRWRSRRRPDETNSPLFPVTPTPDNSPFR